MSLPKQPHLSASSSKQSLGSASNTSRSRTGTAEPHATTAPFESSAAGAAGAALELQYQQPADDVNDEERQHSLSASPQPPFRPFFTLIEDANASEHCHPTVHYIFSDDDTDIVTEAALRSLEADHGIAPAVPTAQDEGDPELDDSRQSNGRKTSSLPPPIPGVREHYVILDMEPTNPEQLQSPDPAAALLSTSPAAQQQQQPPPQFTITSVRSLTPAWQVLNTQLTPAPTFDSTTLPGDQQQPGSSSGLMLKIEGTSGLPRDSILRDRDGKDGGQTLEEMMEQFEKRMGELRRVIEVGGGLPTREDQGVQETELEGQDDTEQEPAGLSKTNPVEQQEEQERNQPEQGGEVA